MKQIVIDVREPYEYVAGHVDGALNIPLASIMDSKGIENLPRDARIILYCRSGNRSGMAMRILEEKGFLNVINGINQQRVQQLMLKQQRQGQ